MKATAFVMVAVAGVFATLGFGGSVANAGEKLGVPLECEPGRTCFLQQYADMDPGPHAQDPFCEAATYDGHRGTDVRIPSMVDVRANVPVLALADGRVLRTRDGDKDDPVLEKSDWAEYRGRHCGNGAIVKHADGLETQYCHLKNGSLRVGPGDSVRKGEQIGAVGASGMAAFPHLHVTVRLDGHAVDPFTGRTVGKGCLRDGPAHPLWSNEALAFFDSATTSIMAVGLSGEPPVYDRLMPDGPPPRLKLGDDAIAAWGWFLNLKKGDTLHYRLTRPNGSTAFDETTKPLERTKAAYMQYVSSSASPTPGTWRLVIELLRNGEAVEARTANVDIGAELVSHRD